MRYKTQVCGKQFFILLLRFGRQLIGLSWNRYNQHVTNEMATPVAKIKLNNNIKVASNIFISNFLDNI